VRVLVVLAGGGRGARVALVIWSGHRDPESPVGGAVQRAFGDRHKR